MTNKMMNLRWVTGIICRWGRDHRVTAITSPTPIPTSTQLGLLLSTHCLA